MKVKSSFTGLALMSIAFHSVASLPKVVAERDIAPLGIACNEKVSAPSISDSELISILRLHYSVNKEHAKRVVAMLNTIPDLQSKDCKDIDIKYNNHHNN